MIIALCGLAGSGKSTIGSAICSKLGYTRYSMASPLKGVLASLFSWDKEQLFGHLKEVDLRTPFVSMTDILIAIKDAGIPLDNYQTVRKFLEVFEPYVVEEETYGGYPTRQYFISPRKAMQLFGTDVCRELNTEVWLDMAEIAYKKCTRGLLIDDTRFENELKLVEKYNGVIINVVGRRDTTVDVSHVSEKLDVTKFNHITLDNSGSLKTTLATVQNLCDTGFVIAGKGA